MAGKACVLLNRCLKSVLWNELATKENANVASNVFCCTIKKSSETEKGYEKRTLMCLRLKTCQI